MSNKMVDQALSDYPFLANTGINWRHQIQEPHDGSWYTLTVLQTHVPIHQLPVLRVIRGPNGSYSVVVQYEQATASITMFTSYVTRYINRKRPCLDLLRFWLRVVFMAPVSPVQASRRQVLPQIAVKYL